MAQTLRPQALPSQPIPLGWFVFASLVLHGLLLAGWSVVRPDSLGENTGSAGSITLQAVLSPPVPATQSRPTPKPLKKAVRRQTLTRNNKTRAVSTPKVVAKQTTEHRLTKTVAQAQEAHPVSMPKTTDTETNHKIDATPVNAAQRHQLLGRIHIALAEHFKYPMQAQRLGWQGTVLLGFRLTSKGQIEAIHVEQSSGYGLLDKAAVTALSQVEHVQPGEPYILSSLDLTLPVIYRIEER